MKIDNSMNFFVGDTAATKILLGSTLLWPLVFLYNKITYTSTNGNIVTLGSNNSFGANIISNEYKDGLGVITFDKDITKIPSSAFSNCSTLSSIDIPESVTSIGNYAFEYCGSLASVNIPVGVASIGNSAFRDCDSLTSVTIPDSVTTIGISTFRDCAALETIIIPDSVIEINAFAFGGSNKLNTYFKSLIPPYIDIDSFRDFNTNRRIYVPYSAMITYKNVPYWSNYTNYIVGYNFETNTSVTDINTLSSTNKQILYTSSDNKVVTPHNTDAFGANIISNEYTDGLGVITFDADVTEIGFGAFFECESLTAIKIPYTVSTIQETAFAGCESLMYINLNNVTTIDVSAFDSCVALTNIHIPDNVTTLASGAFSNTINLKVFTGKFAGNTYDVNEYERYLKDNATLIGYANDSGTEFTIPSGVLHIGRLAFYGCDKLTSITMNNVFSIGEYAFNGCDNLKSVYCNNTTVPTGGNDMFHDTSPDLVIYVPENRVDAYKNAEYWSDYADAIRGYNF